MWRYNYDHQSVDYGLLKWEINLGASGLIRWALKGGWALPEMRDVKCESKHPTSPEEVNSEWCCQRMGLSGKYLMGPPGTDSGPHPIPNKNMGP